MIKDFFLLSRLTKLYPHLFINSALDWTRHRPRMLKEKDAMDEARLEAEMELTIQHRIIEELKQKHQEETNELKIKKIHEI